LGLLLEAQRIGRDTGLAAHAAAAEVFFGAATNKVVTKGDTQKADNAPVPDHLWLRAFVLGYGDGLALAHHTVALGVELGGHVLKDPPAGKDPQAGWLLHNKPPPGWKGALTGFRVFGLRYWCRLVTRGYLRWRIGNVPLPPPLDGALVVYHMEWRKRAEQPIYGWSKSGRRAYQAEWQAMRSTRMEKPWSRLV
jgi:hypothetical protein